MTYFHFPYYLAIAPDKNVYKVSSWIVIDGWVSIKRPHRAYYENDGSVKEKYKKAPLYLRYKGKMKLRKSA